MIDRYTKVVLTVIALSLSVIAIKQFVHPADAQSGAGCGTVGSPCRIVGDVRVTNPVVVLPESRIR